MAGLRKFEVMVRQNSKATMDYLIVKYKRIMNDFQNKETNKKEDGSFLFIWYAEIFDSRTTKIYRVFCDYATKLYDIGNAYTTEGGRVINGVIYMTPYIDNILHIKDKLNYIESTQEVTKAKPVDVDIPHTIAKD